MPYGLAKPFNLKKIINPLLSYVTGCFHGIKLSLGKWALLILPNSQSPSGISLNSRLLILIQIKWDYCFNKRKH